MGDASEWNAVAADIVAAPSVWSSPHVARLFALAEEDGRKALGSFASEMGDEAIRDLIRDLLSTKLELIVGADEPRAYFWKAVRRRAISWKRRAGSRVEASRDDDAPSNERPCEAEEARVDRIDRERRWARLSPREQEILSAIHAGEDRDHIADYWKTTRNNIDKVVSRARKRLAEEGS